MGVKPIRRLIFMILLLCLCLTATAYSEPDQYLLARLITAEAANQPYDGMLAVGTVVINRMAHSSYPDTLRGVIYQKGQFARPKEKPTDRALEAAAEVLSGARSFPENVLLFQREQREDWYGHTWHCTIGDHSFYAEVE